ncbi:hypothetical protein ACWGLB_29350 [Streptomyces sp. NPDC055893]|uniref:hypothetical protein n=1 Tax=Streptomyces sp. NPDC059810 TaxID=3346956 RepID=UPI003663816E
MHSRRDREAAAETWLLLAAKDARRARTEWKDYGVALLRCGGLFSAIRIPAAIVWAAVGTSERDELAGLLAEALDGPCFFDGNGQHFYALTPHSTAGLWKLPDAECLGSDFYLGVPATSVNEPDPRCAAYWVVPMDGPAALCPPAAVACLVQRGRSLVAAAQAREARDA